MRKYAFFLSLSALLLLAFSYPAKESATEIIQKAEQKLRGKSSKSILNIKIVRPQWTREIKTKTWTMGNDYAMIFILEPSRDKGTVFLKRQKEIWNWQPAIERTIKMPPSMMMQSWMGSDFTNDDLVRESSIERDYTHKLSGDSTVLGRKCHRIILTPKPDAPVVWGKIISYISADGEYLQLFAAFYDEDGELVNTLEAKEVGKVGSRTLPTKVRMVPADKPGHYTEMTYDQMEFDIDIQESFFTTQNMRRIN